MAGSNLVQSLLRGLDILDRLSVSPDGLALRDVADALEVGPSTAHNLLRTLAARGFVEKDGATYRLGEQLDRLYMRRRSESRIEKSERILLELHEQFPDATLTYDEPRGADLVVLSRIAPSSGGVVEHPEGKVFGAYTSISGLVMLAFVDSETFSAIRLEYPFSEYGSRLWKSFEVMEIFLEALRLRGYGTAPFAGDRGILRLAVPVRGADGTFQGVLGLSSHESVDASDQEKQVAEALLSAAEAFNH